MTIFLLTGTPGSGKSLHMAKNLYWHVKRNRPVVCNFEINGEIFEDMSSFHYIPNEELSPERLIDFAQDYWKTSGKPFKEGGIKLYWDEAQVLLNSRSWKKNEHWIPFFTQHRKLGYDIYLVCQYHEMLDKQARSIVEYQVDHRKVNNVGLFGKFVTLFALGRPVIVAVTSWYGQKMRISSEWMIGTKRDYSLYDTFKIFDTSYDNG